MEQKQQHKPKYVPEELNNVFWKVNRHIIKSIKLYERGANSSTKKIDYDMLEEQLSILQEKFAHDLLKVLAESKAKFAKLPTIQKNVQLTSSSSLNFYVL